MDMQTRLCSQAYQRPGQPLLERGRGRAGAQATLSLKGGSKHCYKLSPG